MKKNNATKILLALALATAVVGPKIETTYAVETSAEEKAFKATYEEFEAAIKNAKEARFSYKYINATDYLKKGLDRSITNAEDLLKSIDKYKVNEDARLNMYYGISNLKLHIDALNGEKTSIKELEELLNANEDFTKSYAFKYASKSEKDAYVDAYNEAYKFYLYNADDENVSLAKVKAVTDKIKLAKNVITKTYAPFESKQALKDEIAVASQLRNDGSKYTTKSFDSFISALRLAETSVEDKSNIKTAEEYKELAATLKAARLALVKKDELDKDKKLQIKRLEEAKEKNKTSIEAARLLLDIAPEKVKGVKGELLKLIKESEELVEMADKVINELKGIKG